MRCWTKQKNGEVVYADGFYDRDLNKIVVNPEGTRSAAKLLIHELTHAIYRTADKAKKYAKTALLKFKDGIVVNGIRAKVNKTSRDEYIRSNYSEALRSHEPDVYADKLRAATVINDVVLAATDWQKEGQLTHIRKDNIVGFDKGQALIQSGRNKYIATVIVGITSNGEYIFYDVDDIRPAQFNIKKGGALHTATPNMSFDDNLKDSDRDPSAVTPNRSFDAILKVSDENIISLNEKNVKKKSEGKYALSSNSDGNAEVSFGVDSLTLIDEMNARKGRKCAGYG